MPDIFFESKSHDFLLYQGNVLEVLSGLDLKFDMVFADPPYFLSNGGLTVKNGRIASVNKGDWDISSPDINGYDFNLEWIVAVSKLMKENATIWTSGTYHNIFDIGKIFNDIGFRILNTVIWEKTNPPPNFSCRYLTHSNEIVIWAKKSKDAKHCFNYDTLKKLNGGTQMKDVWRLPAVAQWEKTEGKHPTQKPLSLLSRIILASTNQDDFILDPFTGSSTTGIAANILKRNFVGIDNCLEYLELSKRRFNSLDPNLSVILKKKMLMYI